MKKTKFLLFAATLLIAFSCKRTEEVAPVNPEPSAIQPNDSLITQDVPGVPVVIAGSYNHTGAANGTGASARFHTPMGIFNKSDGSMLVADNQNRAIRRISTANVVSTPYHLADPPTDVAAIKDGAVGVVTYNNHVVIFNHGTHVTTTLGCTSCFPENIDKDPSSTFFWYGQVGLFIGTSLVSINESLGHPLLPILISPDDEITSFSVAANDNKFLSEYNQVFECTHSGLVFNLLPGVITGQITSIIANHDGSKIYIADGGVIKVITRCATCKTKFAVKTLLVKVDAFGLALSNEEKVLYFTSMAHHTVSRVVLP
jgi:hypothetical protein